MNSTNRQAPLLDPKFDEYNHYEEELFIKLFLYERFGNED